MDFKLFLVMWFSTSVALDAQCLTGTPEIRDYGADTLISLPIEISRRAYIVEDYVFSCSGVITEWTAYIHPQQFDDPIESNQIAFQVWRAGTNLPEESPQCYSLVGTNAYPTAQVEQNVFQVTVDVEKRIRVQPGDVAGYAIRYGDFQRAPSLSHFSLVEFQREYDDCIVPLASFTLIGQPVFTATLDPDTVSLSVVPTVTQVVSTQLIPPTWWTVSTSIPVALTWAQSKLLTVSSSLPVAPSWTQSKPSTIPSSFPVTPSRTKSEPSTITSSPQVVSSGTQLESTTSRAVSSLLVLTPTSHPSNNSKRIIDDLEEDEALLVTVVPAVVGLVLIVTSVGLLCTVISVYWYSKSRWRPTEWTTTNNHYGTEVVRGDDSITMTSNYAYTNDRNNPTSMTSNSAYASTRERDNPTSMMSNSAYASTNERGNSPSMMSNFAYASTRERDNGTSTISNPAYASTSDLDKTTSATSNVGNESTTVASNSAYSSTNDAPSMTSNLAYARIQNTAKTSNDAQELATEETTEGDENISRFAYTEPHTFLQHIV